jgi:hypothetical protein
MLKSKSQLTCSYGYKIFKNQILLPCEDSICRQHLKEIDVIEHNQIKCKNCNEEFRVRDNQFKFDEALTQLIENQSHLSDEELSLKQDLEISITKLFVFFDEFIQNVQNLHFF